MINLLHNQQTRNKSQSYKDLDVTFITSQIIERSRQGQVSLDDTQLFTYLYQKHPFITTLNQIAQLNLLNDYIPFIQFVDVDSNVLITQNGETGYKFYGLVAGKINHPQLCFGVEALNEIPYEHNVRTLEQSKFLVIDRENFISIITKAKLNEKHGQIDFFKESQIFSKLSKRTIASFIHLFQLTYFRKNQVIYREGDASDFVYMIREGEIELSKQFEIKGKHKHLPVSTIGKPELFGDMDCLFNTCRQYTARCKEQAYCYKISNENFYSIVQKNPQSGIENYINTVMRTQTLSRLERLETASSVISGNRNLLLGMEEVKKENPKDKKRMLTTWSSEKNNQNRIIQRFTPIYSNSNRKKIRVRCATLYNDQPVVRCNQKQTERTDRHEQLLKLKGQLFDEVEIPDRIKRKYQAQLLALKQQTLRKQQLIIRTQNNESKIISSQIMF